VTSTAEELYAAKVDLVIGAYRSGLPKGAPTYTPEIEGLVAVYNTGLVSGYGIHREDPPPIVTSVSCDRPHNDPCTLEHNPRCTLPHHLLPAVCDKPHFAPQRPTKCDKQHYEKVCRLPHNPPPTPCDRPHNEPCTLPHSVETLNADKSVIDNLAALIEHIDDRTGAPYVDFIKVQSTSLINKATCDGVDDGIDFVLVQLRSFLSALRTSEE